MGIVIRLFLKEYELNHYSIGTRIFDGIFNKINEKNLFEMYLKCNTC